MSQLDVFAMIAYVVGIFVIGGLFSTKIKDTSDLFAAGNESPWWLAGTSGFMTMFSAGTFVVWGGIAFQHGFTAVTINMCYGVAALFVGYFVAGYWRKIGISTPAEYLRMRFGEGAIHFYTWTTMFYRIVSVAVALYSVAVMLSALIPLSAGNPLQDPETGKLAVEWAIILFGVIITVYTVLGGLWAVLMTDVLQFIILQLSVLFVVPLLFYQVGGWDGFVRKAPEGFFQLTTDSYSWWFMTGWVVIHFFMIGADWAFVQRFLSVPTSNDASKASYLFGIFYLVSPVIWLLPPILFRVVEPGANHEEAYVLAAQEVLPPGMIGLILAAMFSATASMIDSQINVYAGVLTHDFYKNLFSPDAEQSHLVRVGRIVTVMLGAVITALAIAVPFMGGAEDVVVGITSLMIGPLFLPTIWGLFSRRITQSAIWPTAFVSFSIGLLMKFVVGKGLLDAVHPDVVVLSNWVVEHGTLVDLFSGVLVPVITLTVLEAGSQARDLSTSDGWDRVEEAKREQEQQAEPIASLLPAKIVYWSLGFCALLMGVLWIVNQDVVQLGFTAGLIVLSLMTYYLTSVRNQSGETGA